MNNLVSFFGPQGKLILHLNLCHNNPINRSLNHIIKGSSTHRRGFLMSSGHQMFWIHTTEATQHLIFMHFKDAFSQNYCSKVFKFFEIIFGNTLFKAFMYNAL